MVLSWLHKKQGLYILKKTPVIILQLGTNVKVGENVTAKQTYHDSHQWEICTEKSLMYIPEYSNHKWELVHDATVTFNLSDSLTHNLLDFLSGIYIINLPVLPLSIFILEISRWKFKVGYPTI